MVDCRRAGRARADGAWTVVAAVLERVAHSPFPEAWIAHEPEDRLLTRAREVDAMLDQDVELPLAGVPFAVKDNIDVAGIATTAGCPDFAYVPDRSAPVVDRLLAAGAVFVGKTNLDQFATGLVGTRSPQYGGCRNPHVPSFVAGGSSSGSAVVVATGQVPFALGTDTAGSGRVPAACCGIVGLKPSVGALSTAGVVPAMRSFDCVSAFTGSCGDAHAVFNVAREVLPGATTQVRRLGVPDDLEWFGDEDARARFHDAVERAGNLGCEVVDVDGSSLREAGGMLYGSALVSERHSAFGEFVEGHPDVVHPATREIIRNARSYSGSEVFDALGRLRALREHAREMWELVDALLVPTVARVPTFDECVAAHIAPSVELGRYTAFVNPLGMAAVAVPAGTRASGVPFGVSFVGPAGADDALLALGASFMGDESVRMPARVACRRHLAVVGAHLAGEPLNHQLTDLGARLVTRTTTAAEYRLFALDTTPRKPGLVRAPGHGAAIEVEVWALDDTALGAFVAAIPAPLGVGRVVLADGSDVMGFLCEPHATVGMEDITAYGGWRSYTGSHQNGAAATEGAPADDRDRQQS